MLKDRLRRRTYEEDIGLRPREMIPGLNYPRANPGISLPWLVGLLLKLLRPVMGALTPALKKALDEFLLKFYKDSLETDNPWDDFLALFLLRMFGIEEPAGG